MIVICYHNLIEANNEEIKMTTITFNTLNYANKLKNSGMEAKIAETQADALSEILQDLTKEKLSTKDDLSKLEMRLYAFMVKCVMCTIGILGGLQTLFHFVK